MTNNIRFGDFVRHQLQDPKSEISKATKRLKNWKTLIKLDKYLRIDILITNHFIRFGLYDIRSYLVMGQTLELGNIKSVGDLMEEVGNKN